MFARASCSCLVFPSLYGVATSWERGEGPHRHSQTMFSVSAIPPPLLPLPVPRTWSCCCQLEKLPPIYFPLIHIYVPFRILTAKFFYSFMENLFLANAMPKHAAYERGFFFFCAARPLSSSLVDAAAAAAAAALEVLPLCPHALI